MTDDQPTDPPPPTCTCGGVLREQACEEDCGERTREWQMRKMGLAS